jgi:acetyl-CoA carboxylase carboxyl transferase subunit alpha
MQTYLDFEKPIQELDLKIEELKSKNLEFPSEEILKEISDTEQQINVVYKKIFSNITAWQKKHKFLDIHIDPKQKTISTD